MNRRAFITGLLTAPMIVRATSLDALPRYRTLKIVGQDLLLTEPINISQYDKVLIDRCRIYLSERYLFTGSATFGVVVTNSLISISPRADFSAEDIYWRISTSSA